MWVHIPCMDPMGVGLSLQVSRIPNCPHFSRLQLVELFGPGTTVIRRWTLRSFPGKQICMKFSCWTYCKDWIYKIFQDTRTRCVDGRLDVLAVLAVSLLKGHQGSIWIDMALALDFSLKYNFLQPLLKEFNDGNIITMGTHNFNF